MHYGMLEVHHIKDKLYNMTTWWAASDFEAQPEFQPCSVMRCETSDWLTEAVESGQTNWSQVLPVYLKPRRALLVWEAAEIAGRRNHRPQSLYPTTRNPNAKKKHPDSGPERAQNVPPSAETSRRSRTHRSSKRQTSPAQLRSGSSGVWGTESSQLRPQRLHNWSDVSPDGLTPDRIVSGPRLWTQPVTKRVFSTHTSTHTHKHRHANHPSGPTSTFRHMDTHH